MVTRPARAEHDPPPASNDGQVRFETAEGDLVRIEIDPSSHGVDDGLGLFVNLLLHKVVKFPLHDLRQFQLECLDRSVLFCSAPARTRTTLCVGSQTVNVQFSLGNVGDVVVLEIQHALGVLDDGSGVGSDEEFDGLRRPVFGHECAGLRAEEFLSLRRRGGREEVGCGRDGKGRRTGKSKRGHEFPGPLRLGIMELDIDEIDFEFLLGLDANQEWRSATGGDGFVREVNGFENKGEGALEFLEDGFDEGSEGGPEGGLSVPDVLC